MWFPFHENVYVWLTEGRFAGKCDSDLQSSELIFPKLKFCLLQHPIISVCVAGFWGQLPLPALYQASDMQCLCQSLCRSSLSLQSRYVMMLGGTWCWVPTARLVFCSAAGGTHSNLGLAQFGCTSQGRLCQASHLFWDWLGHVQHRQGSFLSLCRPGGHRKLLHFLMAYILLKVWISDLFFVFFCYGTFFWGFCKILSLGRSPPPCNVKWSSIQISSLGQLK